MDIPDCPFATAEFTKTKIDIKPLSVNEAWKDEEVLFLKEHYPEKGKMWCCEKLRRTEAGVRDKASKLGLKQNRKSEFFIDWQKRAAMSKVGKKRPDQALVMKKNWDENKFPEFTEERKKGISEKMKKYIKENGHPKGFLGGKHTKENRVKMGVASKKMWADENSYNNSDEYRQKLSDRFSKLMNKRLREKPEGVYSRVRKGMVTVGKTTFFARSSWEANVAAYYEFLKERGSITNWEHEPTTFWFEEIKRGVRSYLPDFRITETDGTSTYVEVKGWMDKKSKTKLSRMKKYYPEIRLVVINSTEYEGIKNMFSPLIKNWGILDSKDYCKATRYCSIEGCKDVHSSKGLCRKHYYQEYKK